MAILLILALIITVILCVWNGRENWGLAPVGLLGLGFVVPLFMMLTGFL